MSTVSPHDVMASWHDGRCLFTAFKERPSGEVVSHCVHRHANGEEVTIGSIRRIEGEDGAIFRAINLVRGTTTDHEDLISARADLAATVEEALARA